MQTASKSKKSNGTWSLEKMLQEKATKYAPNKDAEGTTEKRLNDADETFYPHRNPEAWERTGPKRPVNALDEEMGNAGDESKRERSQKAKKTFNSRRDKIASSVPRLGKYIAYKVGFSGFHEVKEIDLAIEDILKSSAAQPLANDQLAKIAALKIRKSELLGLQEDQLGVTIPFAVKSKVSSFLGSLGKAEKAEGFEGVRKFLEQHGIECSIPNVSEAHGSSVVRLSMSGQQCRNALLYTWVGGEGSSCDVSASLI